MKNIFGLIRVLATMLALGLLFGGCAYFAGADLTAASARDTAAMTGPLLHDHPVPAGGYPCVAISSTKIVCK